MTMRGQKVKDWQLDKDFRQRTMGKAAVVVLVFTTALWYWFG